MANEKSQNLKASEDMAERRKDPKMEKAIIKEAMKSKYSSKEPPMKGERVVEGFKARRNAKGKDILKKLAKALGKGTNPVTKVIGSLSDLRNKKKKQIFKKEITAILKWLKVDEWVTRMVLNVS
jgi:hypothetical protein